MTLIAKPSSFTTFHHNLLLWISIYHRHLTVRKLQTTLRYTSGELVFPEGELRKYCGQRLTILKQSLSRDLILQLEDNFDPLATLLANQLLTSLPLYHSSIQQPSTPEKIEEMTSSRSHKKRSPMLQKSKKNGVAWQEAEDEMNNAFNTLAITGDPSVTAPTTLGLRRYCWLLYLFVLID